MSSMLTTCIGFSVLIVSSSVLATFQAEEYDFLNSSLVELYISDYATVCYSCIGAPPLYTTFNHTALFEYLKSKAIVLPELSIECRDKSNLDAATFDGVPVYMCDSGLCAKLKGTFEGKPYIVRECWERLWQPQSARKIETIRDFTIHAVEKEDCAQPPDAKLDWSEVCLCTHDLCNGAKCYARICASWMFMLLILKFLVL